MSDDAKWAVVLGCTGGTGMAVCRRLVQDPGLNIIGMHRGNHPECIEELEREIAAAGRRCHFRVGQAGDWESSVSGAEEVLGVAGQGGVRLFVHAIADASYGLFTTGGDFQLHPKQFAKTFDRMAHSFVYWTQNLLRQRALAEGATLLALTNSLVESAVNGWGLNSAAKKALESYVHHMGNELGPRGYRVMLLKFGLVETRAIQIAFPPGVWEKVKGRTERATPARRLVSLEEVARFISFLTTDLAMWFNATTIDFTGAQVRDLLDILVNREIYEKKEGPL